MKLPHLYKCKDCGSTHIEYADNEPTLLDYFAAHALTGLIAAGAMNPHKLVAEALAECAYIAARKMMEQRNATPQNKG